MTTSEQLATRAARILNDGHTHEQIAKQWAKTVLEAKKQSPTTTAGMLRAGFTLRELSLGAQ